MDVPGKERSSKSLYFFPVNKITKSLGLKKLGKDLERPVEMRPFDIIDGETDNLDKSKLIKEQ